MTDWRLIADPPADPVQVELFHGALILRDQNGAVVTMPPYRDERRDLGFWDGKQFCYCGTGHAINEFGDDPPEWIPTHWRALPPAPANGAANGKG